MYVKAPFPLKVILLPAHITAGDGFVDAETFGKGFVFTVAVATVVAHPLPSVPVTVYV